MTLKYINCLKSKKKKKKKDQVKQKSKLLIQTRSNKTEDRMTGLVQDADLSFRPEALSNISEVDPFMDVMFEFDKRTKGFHSLFYQYDDGDDDDDGSTWGKESDIDDLSLVPTCPRMVCDYNW